ncbi:MAG: hypothetical protein CO133_00600, partial [Candidatus Komeilibacteria bacterium CG_4_9_14_3_um_filter_37_5]
NGRLSDVTFSSSRLVEDYTITFTSGTEYSVVGSVSGVEGTGTLGTDFVSTSGKLSIPASNFAGSWLTGDVATISTQASRTLIVVMPGTYTEASPLVMKSYVDIKAYSSDWRDTIIKNGSDTNLITAADVSSVAGCTLQLVGTTASARSLVDVGSMNFLLINNKLLYEGTTAGYGASITTGTLTVDGGEMSSSGLARAISLTGAGQVNIWNNKLSTTTADLYADAGTINSFYNRLEGSGNNVQVASGAVINSQSDYLDSTKIVSTGRFNRLGQAKNTLVVSTGQNGDFNSITEALAEINRRADAAAANPYIIEVLPGVYNEAITLLPYVDVIGVGGELT